MNAPVAITMLEPTSTDTGLKYYSHRELSTTINDRELDAIENFSAPQSPANDERNDTSLIKPVLKPVKLRSTFARPLANKHVLPAELLAEWSGCVTSVQKEGHFFTATLKGVKGGGVKDEEDDAIIPISDVSEWDKDLLQPGNFFRLCVMYEITPSGQPRRYSLVVFRRLPAYRKQDIDAALVRGVRLARGLRVE